MAKATHLLPRFLFLLALMHTSVAFAQDFPQVMFILDGSGSMWGEAGSQTKIEAAREVMKKVVPELPPEIQVGLTSYGHRRKADCADIEILIPIGSSSRVDLLKKVDSINPKGMTPIADSIKMVADKLRSAETETTIVLVSDGEETCHDDPCGVVKKLKKAGINFILHVVGFGLNQEQKAQLQCLAKEGDGEYVDADDTESLLKAFQAVTEKVETQVKEIKIEQAKTVQKKAVSKLGKLTVKMPSQATKALARLKIVRASDAKVVKDAERPEAESTHPLLAGEYRLVLGYGNSNYQEDSDAQIGTFTVSGGEETEVSLGAITLNLSDIIKKDLPVETVSVIDRKNGEVLVQNSASGNDYYLFLSKPVLAGSYQIGFTYTNNEIPTIVADELQVVEGKETVVTFDSGIKLTPVNDQPVTGWSLTQVGEEKTYLQVKRRWDNDHPLWKTFVVPPGRYNLNLSIKGMDEPLPAGEEVEITSGQLLEFETGL